MVKGGVWCLTRRHWIHLDHINRPSNRSFGAAPLLKSSQLEIWFICFCTTPTSRAIMKCPKHAFELVLVLPWNTLLLCHYHDSAPSSLTLQYMNITFQLNPPWINNLLFCCLRKISKHEKVIPLLIFLWHNALEEWAATVVPVSKVLHTFTRFYWLTFSLEGFYQEVYHDFIKN